MPYCALCNRRFKDIDERRKHLKKHHPGEDNVVIFEDLDEAVKIKTIEATIYYMKMIPECKIYRHNLNCACEKFEDEKKDDDLLTLHS